MTHTSFPTASCGVVDISRCKVLDIRLQVEVKDQNMVKYPLEIYHRFSTLYVDPMMNSVELCISYGKYLRDA